MKEQFLRTSALIGEDGVGKLNEASVLLFGLGGVGGYVAEALVRAGIGSLGLCDGDTYTETNLNRQLSALRSTLGENKAASTAKRCADINPDCLTEVYPFFYTEQTAGEIDFSRYAYIADAVDSVPAKLLIIKTAKALGIPVISCMGTGNKLLPRFEVTDISKTTVCPLARIMRRELKELGITNVKAVYSTEEPAKTALGRTPASISYVPAAAGLTLAGEIIRELLSGR